MKNNLTILLGFFLLACSNNQMQDMNKTEDVLDSSKLFNGIIAYDISYPYNQKDPYLNLYPSKLSAKFNDSLIHTVINDIGININTYFDLHAHEIDQYVEIAFPYHKLHVHLSEKEILKRNGNSDYNIEVTNITDSIGPCQITKAIATSNDSSKKIELWTTEDLDIKQANFFGPFAVINKSLLQFEAKNIGYTTKIKATSIIPGEVKITEMADKNSYQTIPMDSLNTIIANIFGTKN